MGLTYHIYRPKKALTLEQQIALIHESFQECIKTSDSFYQANFYLKTLENLKIIHEQWPLEDGLYSLSETNYVLRSEEIIKLIADKTLYNYCNIYTENCYVDNGFGYRLAIDNENHTLNITIGIPHKDLEESKRKLTELILYLYEEKGIYLGLSGYDNIKHLIGQLIDINSSTGISHTWQLNASGYSYAHGNTYVPNSGIAPFAPKNYRMGNVNIGLPQNRFQGQERIEFIGNLLKALDSYFSDPVNIQMGCHDLKLVDIASTFKTGQFELSSKIDLSKSAKPLQPKDLALMFETEGLGDNEICADELHLSDTDYGFNLRLQHSKESGYQFRVSIYYRTNEAYVKQVGDHLGIELEYESSW